MRKFACITIIFLITFALFAIDFVPNELIIKTKKTESYKNNRFSNTKLNEALKNTPLHNIKAISSKKTNQLYVLSFTKNSELSSIKNLLTSNPDIEYIQYNYLNSLYIVPNDSLWANQLISYNMINMPKVWNYNTGSSQINIGIIDSGFLFEHPDLKTHVFTNKQEIPDNNIDDDNNGYIDDIHGWDFADAPNMSDVGIGDYTQRDNDPTDENFHGTHVAGIIAADTNNNLGVAGTVWNCQLLPIRAGFRTTEGQGFLEDDDAAAALIYAADMGCQVVNLSWGDANYSPIIEEACNYATSKGTILVASAGNTTGPVISYPAKLSNVIAVGAVNEAEQIAGFSSYGPDLDIVAPGQNIMSCYNLNNPYMTQSGTSMSSPFVTAAVALLLSQEPNLNLNQVISRLHTSAKDLGETGFDNLYGAGLLDVDKLLKYSNSFNISLTYPKDRDFVENDFDLIGTVNSPDFFRYSVMFSGKDNPEPNDWKDVYTHSSTPNYFYSPKNNEIIANFHFIPLFPDGNYRIRVQIETKKGKTHTFIQNIIVDRISPTIRENSLFIQDRWLDNKLQHYIVLATSEKVQLDVNARIGNSSFSLYSSVPDSIFSFKIPESNQTGWLDLQFIATDQAGHSTQTNWLDGLALITNDEIDSSGFIEQTIGNPLLFARNTCDFDANQKQEIIAMEIDNNANGIVKALEYQNDSFVTKHLFNEKFNPLYLANKNTNEVDLLALKLDKLEVYSAIGNLNYPDIALWNLSEVNGAIAGDFTNDGTDELLVIRNLADQSVIELYRKQNIEYSKFCTIYNNTPTQVRKMFVPKISLGNLDNDNMADLLTADVDGDIMIYEWSTNNSTPVLTWSKRIPILNAYYLSIADYDGDNYNEFSVGGYVKETDQNKSYWHFEWYKSTSDNQYSKIGEINFSNVITGQSSISEADIDNDGLTELIASITPNVYVIKKVNNQFLPVWSAKSDKTFQIIALNQDNSFPGGFFINRTQNDSTECLFVKNNTPFTGPAKPECLIANLTDIQTVSLSWNTQTADLFNIYRKKTINGVVEQISSVNNNEFTDTGLEINTDYYYSITAIDNNFNPTESQFSTWIKVTTAPQANLIEAKMLNDRRIIISFDQKLNPDSANRGNFTALISNNSFVPASVNLLQSDKAVLLNFREPFNTSTDFTLNYRNLLAYNNIAIPDNSVNISYQYDLTPPYIKSLKLVNPTQIEVKFSELIHPSSIADLANFTIESPIKNLIISFTSISLTDSSVFIDLNQSLQNSTNPYWIKCNNIVDLAGNKIPNNQNRHCLILTKIANLSFMEVYPNPLKIKEFNEVTFSNIPDNKSGEVKIYNLSGDLIFNHKISNSSEFSWPATNNNGKKISSGIYIYLMKIGNDLKKGKIVVIN